MTVAVVLLSHLHYTIDAVGAWAVTYSLYVLAEATLSKFSLESGQRVSS